MVKKILSENRIFVILFGIYLVLGGIFLTQIQKGDAVLWANTLHEPIKDFIFKYLTHVGDGLFFGAVILIFVTIRYYHALMLAVNLAVTGLSIFVLKRLFSLPRPLGFFDENIGLHLVEGVKVHKKYSFPSGHSATAFSLFLGLILISKNKNWAFIYFIFALFATFSRVYLAQHFFIDTYFGAILGTFLATLTYILFENNNVFKQDKWQRGLLKK